LGTHPHIAKSGSPFIHLPRYTLKIGAMNGATSDVNLQSSPSKHAVGSLPTDIVALRISHCRAEHAEGGAQYHLAVRHYRDCLEAAERREDARATQFFALKLAACYDQMGFTEKADEFRALATTDLGDAPLLG
jgi:hypothetical protein